MSQLFFFFKAAATTEIYTLSLHDALPISSPAVGPVRRAHEPLAVSTPERMSVHVSASRSEEHTSELQSQSNLVCRLLLEKKKKYSPQRKTSFIQISSAVKLPNTTPAPPNS